MGNFISSLQASPGDKPTFDNRLTSFDIEKASSGPSGPNININPDTNKTDTSQTSPVNGPNDVVSNQQGSSNIKQQASGYDRELQRIIEDVRKREIKRTTLPDSASFNEKNQVDVQSTIKSAKQPVLSDKCIDQLNRFKNVTGTSVTKKPNWVNNGVICYPDFSGHNAYKDLSVCLTQFPTCYGNDCPPIRNNRGSSKWDLSNCAVPIPKEGYETPINYSKYSNLSNTWNQQKNYNL